MDAPCDFHGSEHEVLRWMYYNNKLVDETAGQTPYKLLGMPEFVRKDTALQEFITTNVHKVYVEVAMAARMLKRYGNWFRSEFQAMEVPLLRLCPLVVGMATIAVERPSCHRG